MPVPRRLESDEDVRAVEEAFHAAHERIFAVREPGQYLECLLWKARATAVLEKPALRPRERSGPLAEAGSSTSRRTSARPASGRFRVHDGDAARRRDDGSRGPAIIREPTTTVVVHPGSAAIVTRLGNYLLELSGDAAHRCEEAAR